MSDQAEKLRQLVQRIQDDTDELPVGGSLVAVVGGQRAVGVTTVACNLAISLVRQQCAVSLVDMDGQTPDVARSCRVRSRYSWQDVAAGRRKLREVLEPGPCGVTIVPGARHSAEDQPVLPSQEAHLQSQLRWLGRDRVVILDAGHAQNPLLPVIGGLARHVLVVTTPDRHALVDTYATIKQICALKTKAQFRSVVNRSGDVEAARDAHRRLALSCSRFLNLDLLAGGCVEADRRVGRSAREGRPVVLQAPGGPASRSLTTIAAQLGTVLVAELHRTPHAA